MSRVFVGLSGGVDSSVSAALMQQHGHEVTGVFIKIWQPEFIECTWKEDRLDAMRVAAHLRIPFREIDLSAEYKATVIDTMVGAYGRGITPNPDVLCNEYIKFGIFYQWARKQGADSVATGHYARMQFDSVVNTYHLLRGIDPHKDQSYFVHRLHGHDLPHIMFPVGGLHKTEVRSLARQYELPVAHKPDSQGLCFVGEISMRDFLKRYISVASGNVIDQRGAIIGTHEGALLYTIGQRHGFTVNHDVPLYILDTDITNNTITVGPNKEECARIECHITDTCWINEEPDPVHTYSVQTRYREIPINARAVRHDDRYRIIFEKPHVYARGQSLVVYDGARCLGGGIIV